MATYSRRAFVVAIALVIGLAVASIVVLTRGAIAPAHHEAVGEQTLVEVTGHEHVSLDGKIVATPCFRYSLPDTPHDWEVVDGSRGCATSIVPEGEDALMQFYVRGMRATGTAQQLLEGYSSEELIVSAEVVSLGGREVARIVESAEDAGLQVATYLVSVDPAATHEGQAVGVVNIGAPFGPWHEGIVSRIIASLEPPTTR